ncbi:MAG: glycine cleavage system aminomethyltransferase GcvT [Clostridiales bacterium]|nr:glycine cleavage system aminomethyltransferase GcvT [Clostridiales bacterium]
MDLQTPLYDCYEKHGGKIVPFAGFLLPIQFKDGIIKEHLTVRERCGLFDVSHMSEMFVEGADALKNLQYILPNDFSTMVDGQVKYSTMLNENGGAIDDLVVYRFSDTKYMIVGNGSNRQKDHDWIKAHITGDCRFTNRSDEYAQLAVQGPACETVLYALMREKRLPAKYYSFIETEVAGFPCIVSQTGYTGELGYELYAAPDNAAALWEALVGAGAAPCGLGARDTLRLEASMCLYGHELNDDITPLEANLHFSVKLDKEDFIGKAALIRRQDSPMTLAGFKITGKGIVREHCEMFLDNRKIGVSTSGTHAPYFGYPVAMGYIEKEVYEVGRKVLFRVRGREVEGEIVKTPFYKRKR